MPEQQLEQILRQGLQGAVDQAVRTEHLGHVEQGHELRDCDRHDQDRSPQFLELDALLIDQDSYGHTAEVS